MSVSHANSPSQGTPRRILGDLTPKALNTPSKRADLSENTRAHSPLKQMQTLSPQLFGDKENALNSAVKGRKRSINEVDDAERIDAKVRVGGSASGNMGLSAAAMRLHTSNTTSDLPVPGSPTERNSPTPEPEHMHEAVNSQDTQGTNNSFSALIDFDLCASQNSVQAPASRAPSPPSPVLEENNSRADLLRTRLCFGIYKVKTNQVTKSGSDIISTWESSFYHATDASTSMAITSFDGSKDVHQVPDITISSARRDHQPVFVKANLDPFRPIGNLKLTPAPVLLPTATSSRILHDYDMPSSPPQVISPEQLRSPVKQRLDYATPVNQSPRSERAEDDVGDGSAQSGLRKLQRFQEGELTSSAVKGNAAKGLMQLMAGKR
ncbi:uncharacterized protein N0V89_001288 [Didymosphaeria variabile]|uniref:Uncharacterized protein n=1 Tax=Didymosphaeria variabile TaxID=1932322 RepID=A0A9W8XWR2_9PLEO|nr:uncharacterized protein N0V89_001288 [Didymosphaeria variabile]KAJ4360721.1 hypothetical protein N0V89_001288 [Didymosphaeria variabile]